MPLFNFHAHAPASVTARPLSVSRRRWKTTVALFAAALTAGSAFGEIWDFPQPQPVGKHVNVATQIEFRKVTGGYYASPPPAVVTVPVSAKVTFTLPYTDAELRSVTWFKDGNSLAATGKTLVLESAAIADDGIYTAQVEKTTKDLTLFGNLVEKIHLQVGPAKPRALAALSTRASLNAANPTLIGGFVLDGGNATNRAIKPVLIRAVGPSLADLGVPKPLAAPVVTLFDAQGNKIDWPEVYIPELDPYALAAAAAPAVDACPLRANAGDFAILQFLPAGAFTAHVSSGDGRDGDVLLEIYEVSDEVMATIAPDYFAPPTEPAK